MKLYEYLAGIVNAQLFGAEPVKRPEDISDEMLIDIARRNHMSYVIFSELIKDSRLGEKQIELMRTTIKKCVYIALVQACELRAMETSFEAAGVKCLPLKGSVIKGIYPRPELREMSDIDVLIAEEDMDKATECLKTQGYTLQQAIKHHDIYKKAPVMVIEAHRSLYDKTVDGNQYRYFKGFDKAKLREGKQYIYDFSPEDFYIYMLAHAAKHFYVMGCGIRNLVDIYVYLKKYRDAMNMEYVEEELRKCGIYDFAQNAEKLAFDWLEGREFDGFEEDLFQYMLDSGIYGKDENGIWNKLINDDSDTISEKALKRWYFFPPLYYMCEYYPWLEDKPLLLPVAWCIRFYRGAFMDKGKRKRNMIRQVKKDQILTYKRIYQRMNMRFSRRS